MNPTVREAQMPLMAGACGSLKKLGLDLHEHAGRDDQAVKGLDGAGGWLEDVDNALVGAHLELLARLLFDVRAPKHRVPLDARRAGAGAAHAAVGSLRAVHDPPRPRVPR